jgi:hypothetical protein
VEIDGGFVMVVGFEFETFVCVVVIEFEVGVNEAGCVVMTGVAGMEVGEG